MRAWDNSAPTKMLGSIPEKRVRANVIWKYVREAGYAGVVVFTCGNAAKALREALRGPAQAVHPTIVEVGPNGDLAAGKWWTPAEIRKAWPTLFDATSGHLPLTLMVEIAHGLHLALGELDPAVQYLVPSGSGETIVCLGMAYPNVRFAAVYDNNNPSTARDNDAPLNIVVDNEFPVQYWHGQLTLGA